MKVAELDERDRRFLAEHQEAGMITMGGDGWAKAAKMEPAVVDGRLLSVSHRHKTRTRRLRRDPRATLYYDAPGSTWLAVEAAVSILDDPSVPGQIVHFMRHRQHRPAGPLAWHGDNPVDLELTEDQFVEAITAEGCILYEFDIRRIYGNR